MYQPSLTHFARADFHGDERVFGIRGEDRFSHIYIIGKTGTGKSTLLETMALQDIERGCGLALIDPHGDLVERIAAQVPARRAPEVIYLNASDRSQPYGYNPLRHVREDRIALAASGFIEVFKKMWPEAWGVRMEHILRNVLMALLEQPHATMHDLLRMLSDRKFRAEIARQLRNETVRNFFLNEFERFSFGYRADGAAPIQNKVGAFLSDPLLNRILTAAERDLHVRQVMDEGRVLLVNLAKGRIGEDSSSLLGVCWSPRLDWLLLVGRSCRRMSGETFSSMLTSFRISRRSPSPTCSRSSASIGSALLSPTNTFISLNRTCATRS